MSNQTKRPYMSSAWLISSCKSIGLGDTSNQPTLRGSATVVTSLITIEGRPGVEADHTHCVCVRERESSLEKNRQCMHAKTKLGRKNQDVESLLLRGRSLLLLTHAKMKARYREGHQQDHVLIIAAERNQMAVLVINL